MEKTGIKVGSIRKGDITLEEGIEKLGIAVDGIIDKIHCEPCGTAVRHDKTLYAPPDGVVVQLGILKERSRWNRWLTGLVIGGIVSGFISLLIVLAGMIGG